MSESADLAVAPCRLDKIEMRVRVGERASRIDAEMLEKRAADEMRRSVGGFAYAEIRARLAKMQRQQLRVRIGEVQETDVAELGAAVERIGSLRVGALQRRAGCSRQREQPEEFAAPHLPVDRRAGIE